MATSVATLPYFTFVKRAIENTTNETRTPAISWKQTAIKALKIVLAVLLIPFAATIDILLLPVIGIRKLIRPETAPPPRAPILRGRLPARPDRVILGPLGERTNPLPAPYRFPIVAADMLDRANYRNPPDDDQFFRESIETGLHFCTREKEREYIDLLVNHGEPEGDQDASINIYHWSAACSLVQYLLFKRHFPENDWRPNFLIPLWEENRIQPLINNFISLPNSPLAATILLRALLRYNVPALGNEDDSADRNNWQFLDSTGSNNYTRMAEEIWNQAHALVQTAGFINVYGALYPVQ